RRLERQPPTMLWTDTEERETGTPDPKLVSASGRRGAETAGRLNGPGLVGRASQSTTEIQTLLRKRLKFVAILSCATFAVCLVVVLLVNSEPLLLATYTVMLAITGGLGRLVWSRRPLSVQQLRRIEIALFASMGIFFASVQCRFFALGWLPALAQYAWL